MNPTALNHAYQLIERGLYEQARVGLQRHLLKAPGDPGLNTAMATAMARLGRFDQALFFSRRAAEASPNQPEVHFNLGQMLSQADQPEQALAAFERGLALSPEHPGGLHRLALACSRVQRFHDALRACERGLKVSPRDPSLRLELAHILTNLGRPGRAVAVLRETLEWHPDSYELAQLLASASNYDDSLTPREVSAIHRHAGRLVVERAGGALPPPARPAARPARLRVAIPSPDLRDHPVGRFLEPVLEHLDPGRFEVTLYTGSIIEDAQSRRLRERAAGWESIVGMRYADVAERLRAQRMDVAFDLSGYTAHSMLLALARRPCPVQVAYLGYPNTTGVAGLTHRFVDGASDPEGAEELCSERLCRLDPCFLCFRPPAGDAAEGALPASSSGRVTFVSFNAFPKVSETCLRLWRRVLERVPGSRLVLKTRAFGQGEVRSAMIERAVQGGLPADRVEARAPNEDFDDHLRAYGEGDIALDTFPYHGTTTTCEALWMGLPVVTLAGGAHHARVGASILRAIGATEWIAAGEDDYVEKAVALASDLPALERTRGALRGRVRASALCDARAHAARFSDAIDRAYEEFLEGRA